MWQIPFISSGNAVVCGFARGAFWRTIRNEMSSHRWFAVLRHSVVYHLFCCCINCSTKKTWFAVIWQKLMLQMCLLNKLCFFKRRSTLRSTLGYYKEIWKALNLKPNLQKLKVPECMLSQKLGKGLCIYWKILLLYIVSAVNKVYVNRTLNNAGSWSLLLAFFSPKGFILPVKRNCIRCNLVYPVLLPSASAFLSIRVACLMICGPFKATILWSVGRCDHKPLCKADQVCPWAAVGCKETHTNTHTHTT